jgi:hypothetical protein
MGIFYLLFCWTLVPAVVSWVEGIVLLVMSKEAFDMKYNVGLVPFAIAGAPQNIVVNVANTAHAGAPTQDLASQLKALHDLKIAGALDEAEYATQKQKLLTSQ